MNLATLHRPLQARNRVLCGPHRVAARSPRHGLHAGACHWLLRLAVGLLLAFLSSATVSRSLACEPPHPSFWTPGDAPEFSIADLSIPAGITGLTVYKIYSPYLQNISAYGEFRSYFSDSDDYHVWEGQDPGDYVVYPWNDDSWGSALEDLYVPSPDTYPVVFDYFDNENPPGGNDWSATVGASISLLQATIDGQTDPLAIGETRELSASIRPSVPGGPFEWSASYGLCFVVDGHDQATATGPSVVIKGTAASGSVGDRGVAVSYLAGPDDLGRTTGVSASLGGLTVVGVGRLEWGGIPVTNTTQYVILDDTVEVTAFPDPEAAPWPAGQPTWSGDGWTGNGATATLDTSTPGVYPVTASCSSGPGSSQAATFTVVGVKRLEWSENDVTDTTQFVAVGDSVAVTAIPDLEGSAWPAGKPDWSGSSWTSNGATATLDTSMPGTFEVTATCGNSRSVTFKVVKATLNSLQFTSDHALLKKNPSSGSVWGDSSTAFEKPEWVAGLRSNPISQTMNTVLSATVNITVEPDGVPYDLIGGNANADASFETDNLTSTGNGQDVDVTAQAALINSVRILSRSIGWGIRVHSPSLYTRIISAGTSGDHKIWLTYGTPAGSVATEKRVEFVVSAACGVSYQVPCADAVFDGLGSLHLGYDLTAPVWGPVPRWLLHDSTLSLGSQCPGLALFVNDHFQMLGLGSGETAFCRATPAGGYEAVTGSPGPVTRPVTRGVNHPDLTLHDVYFPDEFLVHFDGSNPPNQNSFEATCYFAGCWYYALGVGRYATPKEVVKHSFPSIKWMWANQPPDVQPQPQGVCTDSPWVEAP